MTNAASLAKTDNLRGILFMLAGVAMFPFLNASVKLLGSEGYPMAQIVWMRYFGHLVFMLIVFLPGHGAALFRTRQPAAQLARSLLLLSATVFYFLALGHIPLATAASISFTNPFIVTALSVPILGEVVGPRRWLAVLIGFAGALIIIRPGVEGFQPQGLFVLVSASSFAIYQVITRRIAGHDSPATTITYTAIIGALLTSFVVPFHWVTPTNMRDLLLFLGLGFFGGFGHYMVVKAYEWGEASVIAPLSYGQLIGATILGYLLFSDFPDIWTWVGAAVIVACGIYVAYREGRVKGPRPAPRP
ncbi:MAG TPA: DMT family transporter [Alphaproteobacteria bacterium]|nr:DMT family transporter [Alphaproteobacteria bacterium]